MAMDDIYELSTDQTVKGEHCANVFHFKESEACTDPIPAKELINAFFAAVVGDWADLLSDECKFNCFYARRIRPTAGLAYTKLDDTAGTIASEPIPTTSGVVMSLYTATASRNGRGRKYFAGLPEDNQNGGLIEGVAMPDWDDFGILLATELVGANTGKWKLCVYSPALVAAELVIVTTTRTNLGTMKTRRQRPGTP